MIWYSNIFTSKIVVFADLVTNFLFYMKKDSPNFLILGIEEDRKRISCEITPITGQGHGYSSGDWDSPSPILNTTPPATLPPGNI